MFNTFKVSIGSMLFIQLFCCTVVMVIGQQFKLKQLNDRQAIHNQWASQPLTDTTYDYIVVGGGTGGCVVACRLSQRGNNVLMIEAGGAQHAVLNDMPGAYDKQLKVGKDQFWQYYTTPQAAWGGRTYNEIHGKVLGGDSSVNAMVFGRGSSVYYDSIEKNTGARGWSFKDVLPYFMKIENNTDPTADSRFHGRQGPIKVQAPKSTAPILQKYLDTLEEMGLANKDPDNYNNDDAAFPQGMWYNGVRSSTANGYIEFGGLCPKLKVQANAWVYKLLIHNDTNGEPRVSGVQFEKNNKTIKVNATKEVIVSAGNYMSAHLLMLSGIGPRDHLIDINVSPIWADLQIGTSYQNRPAINLEYAITDQSLVGELPMNTDSQIEDCVVNGKGPMCDAPRILVLYNSKINYPKEFVDIINFVTLSPPVAGSNVSVGHAFTFVSKTRAMGTIRLRSNNYRDLPYIDPNVLGHPEDKTRMMDAIAKFFYHIEETSFKKYAAIPEKPQSSECEYCKSGPQWKCHELHECLFRTLGITEFHPLGVIPFGGPNRIEAVLDERLRVKGVRGLRVADASILPVGYTFTPNTGPAYVVMMVAEKVADMITEDNKH